ncbi:MAG: 2-oxoglutarate dehydrogenase E1 component [Puniceicoccaceae bacterium]|nr:MAG: 2-oxoglutarate dehydrogenase E1 component [Puniceicoccaceae bacterium]
MNVLSFANPSNAELLDGYYRDWKADPDSVDPTWRAFFEGFELARNGAATTTTAPPPEGAESGLRQSRVASLIYAYRDIGHTCARLDPLAESPPPQPRLALESFELSETDLDLVVDTGNYLGGGPHSLRDVIAGLRQTYCSSIGFEYLHIQDVDIRRWIQRRIEPGRASPEFSGEQKLRILRKIYQAEVFERFLHTRYAGQKRFSLEGGETLIPCLDNIIEHCGRLGLKEVVMGMAHRGRLNVLANILKKSYDFLFEEFSENYIPNTVAGDGDVKYHLGYETTVATEAGAEIEIRLASNPSHLEAVDPVVEGMARARQRIREDSERRLVVPLLIHGDAAFAGQGIVAEVLNFSQLPGYRTGGTLHIVVNNQIGFTTTPLEARSSRYCTDVAKLIEAPIFHVNGDDPLAVIYAAELALDFRHRFQRDVVIDMVCYRRHGHNEADEPMFTQPLLYQRIAKHPPISQLLLARLVEDGTLTEKHAHSLREEFQETLESALDRVKKKQEDARKTRKKFRGSTAVFQPGYSFDPVDTTATRGQLETIARGLTRVPGNFQVNPKIKRLLEARWQAFQEDQPIDWAYAESLAFGTLLAEGTPVRLSGQDSERGTFSQRHAALYDIQSYERYVPLLHLTPDQARFCVYNSTLSEAGVLGFDFGYSLEYPPMLCIWEAQFGDFVNGAQVIIDQFITSSESKWQRVSGLVMLLPHGYEGQGPEHSSARLERFLQASAEDNIQVCNLTTPAQYFHLLRRQMKRSFRKPLVIMAPKSLLRHKAAVSPWSDLHQGGFAEILADPSPPKKTRRVILCSGKVFYDLDDFRRKKKIRDTALVRVEQLYPLHSDRLKEIVSAHGDAADWVWCQEESGNMGAWPYMAPRLERLFGRPFRYAGRGPSASPAVGSLALHKQELAEFLEDAFSS